MRLKTCPCATCDKFQEEYDEVNGMHVVYCSDQKTRLVDIEKGCGFHEGDAMLPGCEVRQ